MEKIPLVVSCQFDYQVGKQPLHSSFLSQEESPWFVHVVMDIGQSKIENKHVCYDFSDKLKN